MKFLRIKFKNQKLRMDRLAETNKAFFEGIRDKLLETLLKKLADISEETWKFIGTLKGFNCREWSMNKLVPGFRLSPIQIAGSEEEIKFSFLDTRRILCYLLLGNDFMRKWKSTEEAGIGEPLHKEVVEKAKEVAKAKGCKLHKAFFEVEKEHENGDYSLRLVPHREEAAAAAPKASRAGAGGGDVTVVKESVKMPEKAKAKAAASSYATAEIVAMSTTLDAILSVRGKGALSAAAKAEIVTELCELAVKLLRKHDA